MRIRAFLLTAVIAAALLPGGCSGPPVPPRQAPPASAQVAGPGAPPAAPARPSVPTLVAPAPVLPFPEAVLQAADALFSGARLPGAEEGGTTGRHALVIDPLIDGVTGFRTAATRSMQDRIVDLVRARHPRFEVRELTAESLAGAPLVLLGSLAGVDRAGRVATPREAYRIWLVLADLRSGTIVGRGTARARAEGVDTTPAPFFRDSPAWVREDPQVGAYLATCGGKVGDPIDPAYLDGLLAAALLREATDAYDAGRHREALDLYEGAAATPAGDQPRVHNGLFLANWRLGRRAAAAEAFARLVDYGLARGSLTIRFLFKPGAVAFWPPEAAEPYPMWLERLAEGAARRGACLEIVGHTSPTGPAALNERLSLRRAEYVAARLRAAEPALEGRTIALGAGSRENLVGTGRDDETDALDRRVEFEPLAC